MDVKDLIEELESSVAMSQAVDDFCIQVSVVNKKGEKELFDVAHVHLDHNQGIATIVTVEK